MKIPEKFFLTNNPYLIALDGGERCAYQSPPSKSISNPKYFQ